MKDEPQLESFLQSLTPAAPSADLVQRVSHELELDHAWMRGGARRSGWVRFALPAGWAALGAAAAVAVMSVMQTPQAAQGSGFASNADPLPAVMPISTTREWLDAQDQGIRYNDQSEPEHHVKLVGVERHAWIDPRNGAEFTVEIPREDRFVMPVVFQ